MNKKIPSKCYVCFSSIHSTLCNCDQFSSQKLFLPKIDVDLLPRFLQSLGLIEQYTMAFTFPIALNLILLKPLKVKTKWHSEIIDSYDFNSRSNICFNHFLNLKTDNELAYMLEKIQSKEVVLCPRYIILEDFEITAQNFYLFLPHLTLNLTCLNVTVTEEIKFAEILAKIPCTRWMKLVNSNILIETSWPEDLLRYKTGNDFEMLDITVTNFDFNVEALAKFMESKCWRPALFAIRSRLPKSEYQKLKPRIMKYFDKISNQNSFGFPLLQVGYIEEQNISQIRKFALKQATPKRTFLDRMAWWK